MKISTMFYIIAQGIKNLFRNAWYTLASIATIAACLFLFNIFYVVISNFENTVRSIEEGVSVTVFFEPGIEETRIQEIGALISARTEVAKVRYVSADEAWSTYQKEYFGDRVDEFIAGYPENPLADYMNYEVYLSDVSMQQVLVNYLYTLQGVREVRQDAAVASTLSGFNSAISYISIVIIGILLAVSIFLISNTVTMGIQIRKEEINIMKYVGATDFFVRAPFVIEGAIIGVIGACIPLAIIRYMYTGILTYVTEKYEMLTKLLAFKTIDEVFKVLTPVCLCVGIGIGLVGSITTVRKHLKV